jgi:hypothetical protein
MKYQQPTFSVPVSNGKVTQEEWDRIFSNKQLCDHCNKPVIGDGDRLHIGEQWMHTNGLYRCAYTYRTEHASVNSKVDKE